MTAQEILQHHVLKFLEREQMDAKELANRLKLSQSWASLFVNGKRTVPIKRLDALAAVMHTTVPELFREPRAESEEPGRILTAREERAWNFAMPPHRKAALTLLRLGRKESQPQKQPPTGVPIAHRRLVDYLNEENRELETDQG